MNSPTPTFPLPAPAVRGTAPDPDVGEILRRLDAGRTLSDQELEEHISDCRCLMERAYARFQAHGNPADRDEAELWMHRRDEAMRMRRPEVQAAREAEIWKRIGGGC